MSEETRSLGICASCILVMTYWNLHAASLTKVDGVVIPQPANMQQLCEFKLAGKVVNMNTRPMNMAVAVKNGLGICSDCLADQQHQRRYN